MLTAVLLGAVVLSAPGAGASARPTAVFALEWVRQDSEPELSLLRLDPQTLAETGRAPLGSSWQTFNAARAFAPDRLHLGVSDGRNVHFVDVDAMRPESESTLSDRVLDLAWPTPGRVLAVSRGEFARIDPRDGRLVSVWSTSRWISASQAARGQIVAVAGPAPVRDHGLRGGLPIEIGHLAQSGSPRWTRVDRIRYAIETWRVRRGALLPPLARQGVEQAMEDLAVREPGSLYETKVVSVVPFVKSGLGGFLYQGHYEIVLAAHGEYFLYTAHLGEVGGIDANFSAQLPGPPLRSKSNILHAPLGTWEVSRMTLAVGPRGNRAYVLTPSKVFIEIELQAMRVRYRQFKKPLGNFPLHARPEGLWESPSSQFVAPSTIAVASSPVKLIDIRTAKVRSLDRREGSAIERAEYGFVLSAPWKGSKRMTIYNTTRRPQYSIELDGLVDRVQVEGLLAYVTVRDLIDDERSLAVLDLAHGGRELHREQLPEINLLAGRG